MGSLSYTVAEDDQIIFKVITGGYAYKVVQVIKPFYGASGLDVIESGLQLKVTHAFREDPHLIGFEGECLHTHTSVTLSVGDVLAYMAQLGSGDMKVGYSPTSLTTYKCESIVNQHILTPPCVRWRLDRNDLVIYHNGSFVSDEYQGTYGYSSTTASCTIGTKYGTGYRKQSFRATNIQCPDDDSLSYEVEEKDFHSKDSSSYSDFVSKKSYHLVPGGTQSISHSTVYNYTPLKFFLSVKRSAFYEAITALKEHVWEYIRFNPDLATKVCFMPVEESFLDDLYESLAIPSMNSVATIIELLGSVRNAKNVTNVFKYIKKNGGIRQTLIKEGSSILKDKKLSTASNLYLTKKYVYDTTRMDVDDFFEKLSTRLGQLPSPVQHFRWQKPLGMNSESVHCIRLAYQPYEYSWAELYGFDLPMEATWDVIPYSFVLDWFCSFGDSLESIDKVNALQKVQVISCTESYRVSTTQTYEVKINGVAVQFCTQSVSYNRLVTNSLPPVYPRSPKLSNPFRHIIDGAALVFSRR